MLLQRLEGVALFRDLPPEVVPLRFSIRVPERDSLRRRLSRPEIYAPVHCPLAGVVPEQCRDSHELSSRIMTLRCDQRYDASDLERVAAAIVTELES